MTKKRSPHRTPSRAPAAYLTALVANADGEILDLEGYAAVGMDGPILAPLTTRTARRMPHGS
jgi:hypothetical protein